MESSEGLVTHASEERRRFRKLEKDEKLSKKARSSQDATNSEERNRASLICSTPPGPIEFHSNLLLDTEEGEDEGSSDARIQGPRAHDSPAPVLRFDDARLPPHVFSAFVQSKYGRSFTAPTEIQTFLWPNMLRGLDCIAVSPTGSGKTLAYVLPLICHALSNKDATKHQSPTCLVLGPTRELVSQIGEVVRHAIKVAKGLDYMVAYGGDGQSQPEGGSLIDVLVATPGRCLDLVAQLQCVSLSRTSLVVLDEADKMLQMGFVPDVRAILSYTPSNRQTVLVTATWTSQADLASQEWVQLEKLIRIHMGVEVALNGLQDAQALTVSSDVSQIVQVCAAHKKPRKLIRHIERLRNGGNGRLDPMLVFCNKIKTVLFVYEFLARQRVPVCAIHGQMTQEDREKALENFKACKYECLVATDVAGRGLHIPKLVHVVNYDFPTSLPQYAHRIGRCGRSKTSPGSSFSFFTRNLAVMAPDLVKLLQASKQAVDPNLRSLAEEVSRQKAPAVQNASVEDSGSAGLENPEDTDTVGQAAENEAEIDVAQASDEDANDDDDDGDDDSINELLDFVGAVPLMPFVPGKKAIQRDALPKSKKNQMKRPRGKRGGKKNRKKGGY